METKSGSIKLLNGNYTDQHNMAEHSKIEGSFGTSNNAYGFQQHMSPTAYSSKFPAILYPRKLEPFDLSHIKPNEELLQNKKYMQMLSALSQYNMKLEQNLEDCVVQYKYHEFLFTSLQTCHSKTPTQINMFLAKVSKFQEENNQKRGIIVIPKKKSQGCNNQDEIIRQNFKSYLPLQIDEYRRKKFFLSPVSKKVSIKNSKKKAFNILNYNYDESDEEDKKAEECFIKRLSQNDQIHEQRKLNSCRKGKEQSSLPNLCAYKMEILKMKKVIEEREEKKILLLMKKNQSRLQTHTTTNFFHPMQNSKDIFIKTSQSFMKPKNGFSRTHQSQDPDECINDTTMNSGFGENKQNETGNSFTQSLFSQTSQSFNEMKKKKLEDISLQRKKLGFNNLSNKQSTINQPQQTISEEGEEIVEISPITMPKSIDGMRLMKNPFEVIKTKKGKKKK